MVSNTPLVILAVACIINNIHNWNLLKANTKRQRARFERTKNRKTYYLPSSNQWRRAIKLKRKDAESKRKQAAMNVFHQRAKPPRYDKIKSKTVLTNDTMTDIFNVGGLDTSKQSFDQSIATYLLLLIWTTSDDTKEVERRP
ncbi:unnamed protein product [Rhizophagus irregularis]|nr:unnamed protein product [Rhizophagus irregularis]